MNNEIINPKYLDEEREFWEKAFLKFLPEFPSESDMVLASDKADRTLKFWRNRFIVERFSGHGGTML